MTDDYLDYVDSLRRYHQSLKFEPTPSTWSKVAPEMLTRSSELLLEKTNQLEELKNKIKSDLSEKMTPDQKMWRESFIELSLGVNAAVLEKQISWLRRFIANFTEDKPEIGEEEIEQAKQVPLETLIPDLKLKSGKLLRCCPFHDEKTPSFTVFKNNRYYCFGCGEHGDPITWVMKSQHINFIQAIKYLIKL